MVLVIPHLIHILKTKNGPIVRYISRSEKTESGITEIKLSSNQGFTFRYKGQDALVLAHREERYSKGYKYVLVSDNGDLAEARLNNNLSNFVWVKHPLLEDSYISGHNPSYVLSSWENNFFYKADSNQSPGLRSPQIGALHAIEAHWSISDGQAIIVLPTGTGKTETMLSCTIAAKPTCLLVIVPTDALRDQLSKKFATLGVLPEFGIVGETCENPIVGIVRRGFTTEEQVESFFSQINVAVATMSVLQKASPAIWFEIAQRVSHLFLDEAHHTAAKTWKSFKDLFADKRVLLFTATPFRNDGKRLDGKIIYNFPLKKAQEQEYFKPILFKPVNEYDRKIADEKIAELAVSTLQRDLEDGFDHILMVRVNQIFRAEDIVVHYEKYPQYNPIIVHSRIKPKKQLKQIVSDIIKKKHRIIICVDMLGEGFDLPELKIAAFHDTKKSLAITLQVAGRFTRIKPNLGPATFIANIAEPEVTEDLENLYYKDSDWNLLLPDLSFKMSLEQEDFRTFLEGFKGFPDKFPIQAIRNPLSTIIYQAESRGWNPLNYKAGLQGADAFDYYYSDYNDQKEILLIILGKKSYVKWAKIEDFTSMNFDIIVCYFHKKSKLLYIHSSNTNSYFEKLAGKIAPNSVLLKGPKIFRCFHGFNRLRLHNVGVREPMGRAMNYIMRVGSDIKTALTQAELNKAIKSNIFGVGFEHGSKNSIGCSHNGRVWSMRSNNIPTWMKWCRSVAKKITDESIDPNLVLKGTLIPQVIARLPEPKVFSVEWPDFIYREQIGVMDVKYTNGEEYPVWNCDLNFKAQTADYIEFILETPVGKHSVKLFLINQDEKMDYRFEADPSITIVDGQDGSVLAEYFYKYPPLIYFVDGSFLEGNMHTEITHIIPKFQSSKVIGLEWENTDLKAESQTYLKKPESIQYYLLQKLKAEGNYEIIMDDDDSGEIADIVAFKVNQKNSTLNIDLFHCKYAIEGTIGTRIDNFYAVCSQAQKSIKWMENTDMIFKQLVKRSDQRFRRTKVDRFEKGDKDTMDLYKRRAKKDLKVKMNVYIVQPGLSTTKYKEDSDISRLLAVVETYLKETWNASLLVYANKI